MLIKTLACPEIFQTIGPIGKQRFVTVFINEDLISEVVFFGQDDEIELIMRSGKSYIISPEKKQEFLEYLEGRTWEGVKKSLMEYVPFPSDTGVKND